MAVDLTALQSWRALRRIRLHLTREVTNTVARSIVSTLINYSNSLFYGAFEKYLDKLQRLQNKLAARPARAALVTYSDFLAALQIVRLLSNAKSAA